MFELTPWQTWVFLIMLGFAIYGFITAVTKLLKLIVVKRKEYHI